MDQNNNFQQPQQPYYQQPQQPQQPQYQQAPQQPYQQPYYQQPQMPPKKKGGALGIISLIIGIVSIIFCWPGCLCSLCALDSYSNPIGGAVYSWIIVVLALVGIVLAIVSMKGGKNGLAIAGLVLCILGLIFCLIGSSIASCACSEYKEVYGAFNDFANGLNDVFGGYGF
ncbi:MAG: hypothetical protein IJC50_02400 [Clostridia bacterium]|nr:hypothetical protein [Clostridia bacterium]